MFRAVPNQLEWSGTFKKKIWGGGDGKEGRVVRNVKRWCRDMEYLKKKTTRTERGVIFTSDVTFCARYHYRLVHPVDEAVDVYTFEGITVLAW